MYFATHCTFVSTSQSPCIRTYWSHWLAPWPRTNPLIFKQVIATYGCSNSMLVFWSPTPLSPRLRSYVSVNSKTAHPPPPANPGAFDFFKKFWSNFPLCCRFDGQMPHPLEPQRGSNPPPCHAMHS